MLLGKSWTPIEINTPRKAELFAIAAATGRSRAECLGLIVEFWCWATREIKGGHIAVDVTELPVIIEGSDAAFWSAVAAAGWLTVDETGFSLPRTEHWLTADAKRQLSGEPVNGSDSEEERQRKLASERQRRRRKQTKINGHRDSARDSHAQSRVTKRDVTHGGGKGGEPDSESDGGPSKPPSVRTGEVRTVTDPSLPRLEGRADGRTEPNRNRAKGAFASLTSADLSDTAKVATWLKWQDTECRPPVIENPTLENLYDVVAAAEHALKKGQKPVAYFATIVGRRDFDLIPEPAKKRARTRVEKYLRERNGASVKQ